MTFYRTASAIVFASALIALSAGPAPAALSPAWGHHGYQNLSGQYSGSVTDGDLGTGTATANLVSANGGGRFDHFGRGGGGGGFGGGSSLGGYFGFEFGSSTSYIAPTVAGGGGRGGLNGTFEATIGGAVCIFEYSASYTLSTFALSGTYKAINGCSGDTGTFTLTQQCYYDESATSSGDARRQTSSGLGACS